MADSFALKAILSAVDKLTPTLKIVQKQAQNARKYLGDVGGAINNITSKFGIPLGIVSTIAAGFGIAAIKKAVVSYAELGEEVSKGALKAGMSAEMYQRMKYVAEQSDTEIGALTLSLGKLNKNIGAAASGKNADLVQLFKTLHIPLRDVNGQIRNGADMLPQLAEAFKRNQNPVAQAAIGTALFGKAYAEILPLLNDGAEGIEKNLERFKMLKGVISADDLAGAKEFGDKLKDLEAVTKGFQMTIAKELVPVLSPVIESFIQWAAANKRIINAKVKEVVQGLVAEIKKVNWTQLAESIRRTIESIGSFIDRIGGARNALILLALVMNAQTILAILGLIGAVGRLGLVFASLALKIPVVGAALAAIGTWMLGAMRAVLLFSRALLLSPLGVVLAIAGAAWLIYENWDVLKAWFTDFFANADHGWRRIVLACMPFVALGKLIVDNWDPLLAWFTSFFEGWDSGWKRVVLACFPVLALGKQIIENWEPLKTWFTSLFDWLMEKFAWAARLGVAVGRAVAGVFTADSPQASAAMTAASLGGPGPAAAPGSLGSGSFNLNAPTQATLNGKLDVTFKDAPPGMRVEQARTDGPRVALNTDVGYRYTSNLGY